MLLLFKKKVTILDFLSQPQSLFEKTYWNKANILHG